jgi:hypothetical protein
MDPPLNLALIQWYDFKSLNHSYLHGCSHIKLKDLYNFVAIEKTPKNTYKGQRRSARFWPKISNFSGPEL